MNSTTANRVTNHSSFLQWLVAFGFIGIAIVGCGGKQSRDGFVPAYGTVTLDDKPLPNAEIVFETDNGRSLGRTDSSGKYRAQYTRTLQGVATGTARVRISTKVVFADENISAYETDPKTGEVKKPELVPPNYNEKTELTVEIKDNGAPYDFKLTSK